MFMNRFSKKNVFHREVVLNRVYAVFENQSGHSFYKSLNVVVHYFFAAYRNHTYILFLVKMFIYCTHIHSAK